MTICIGILLGLQMYWTYESYQNNTRIFKSDINSALDKSVSRLMDLRRDEFASQYKKWLLDTSIVSITCRYNPKAKSTVFRIKDAHPADGDTTFFSIGFTQFKKRLDHLDSAAKHYFVDRFVAASIHRDLQSGTVYFYTQHLGDLMEKVYDRDRLNMAQLTSFYQDELLKVGIDNSFQLLLGKDKDKKFSTPNESLGGYQFATRQYYYGFRTPMVTINAYFPNPNLVLLQKMKWLLVSSFLLIGITIACFIFTVKTMLSQSELATMKDTFVNNMTHELKTPVATISIAAEAVQSFNLNASSADEYLSIIRHQAAKLTTLIDQILQSSLDDQAKLSIKHERINFKDVLENCIKQYQPQLQSCHAVFSVCYPDYPIYVSGDEIHLSNLLTNLLDNAIKYGSENPKIELNVQGKGDYMIFEITNDGEGIPLEYQEKVFERFFRVPSGNTHKIKGYGLGLTYADEITRQHGGTIMVKSNQLGTTFIISLPLLTYEIAEDIIA